MLTQYIKREFLVYIRKPCQILNPILFFLLIISLFPMGGAVELQALQKLAPGLIWISVLLASMVSIDRIFYYDYQQGVLEQYWISPVPLEYMIYAKFIIHWLMMLVPLLAALPFVALMYDFSLMSTMVLAGALLVGTPIIAMIIMCLATLVLAAGNQNALFALIFMPLMTPVLIFGSSSVLMQQQGLDSTPILLLLLGVALLLLVLGPMLIKKGLALALE